MIIRRYIRPNADDPAIAMEIAEEHTPILRRTVIIGVANAPITYAPVQITINSTEANAAQNSARKQIEKLKEPESRFHEKVVLYWYQARADASSTAGDRGIIESISPRPVKVICATDTIKFQMVLDDENPFKEAYVVDVFVETIKGKPALYKVIAMHEKFERDQS